MSPPGAVVRATPGDYHGRRTMQIDNGLIEVEVLASAGPRIIGLRSASSTVNLLAETPDLGWETSLGRYELLGGHRLWIAPEDPAIGAAPDSVGLTVDALVDGLRMTGAVELATGCVRSIEVRLDPGLASLAVLHCVENRGLRSLELAPWAITQLPLGGQALLPQRPALPGHRARPNRNLVLWPYSSWEDPRLCIRDGLVAVRAVAGAELKVGFLDDTGWVAYVRDGTALVRRFDAELDQSHPDLGCNVEVYCGSSYVELEVLGPLRILGPGASMTLLERWEVRDVAVGEALALRDELDQAIDAGGEVAC